MMSRLAARSATRTGNRLLACTYSLVALALEAGLILALLHGVVPAVVSTAAALGVMVVAAVRHPELLLRPAAPAEVPVTH